MKKDIGDKLMEQAFGNPKYRGKHVIVIGGQIFSAATGKQAQKILEDVNKKYPKEIPIITYIPKSESLFLLGSQNFMEDFKVVFENHKTIFG